jgi:hypothetical protein
MSIIDTIQAGVYIAARRAKNLIRNMSTRLAEADEHHVLLRSAIMPVVP